MSGGTVGAALRRARFWRRVRRIAPLVALLLICLALLGVVTARVVRAGLEARNARQVEAGAALGVRPWMTIPYIARVYHVPESELFAALGLADNPTTRRAPLRALADHHGRDVDSDIATLNALIDARRPPPPPGASPRPPIGPTRPPARPRSTP